LGADGQHDAIRLRNLLRDAERLLVESGMRRPTARDVLARGRAAGDPAFWRDAGGGLALFLGPHVGRHLRLPYHPRELLVVGPCLHVEPLLPLLCGDGRFHVLALSQRRVRLFEGSREELREVQLHGVPAGLAEAMRFDDRQEQLQLHETGPARPGGRPAAMFHGHGVGSDDAKDRILRYFREVDHGVHSALGDERAPLVLAAVDYLRPLYQAASSYPDVLEQGIHGNPDNLDPHELHRRSWKVVRDRFRRDQQTAAARFREFQGGDRATSDPAGDRGGRRGQPDRVAAGPMGTERWGGVDPATGAVQVHREPRPGDVDLLDLAAVETVRHGGTAYPLEPGQTRPAATLRC